MTEHLQGQRPPKAESSSERILQAAAKLAAQQGGYDELSIADIARGAGVSSALIHARFKSPTRTSLRQSIDQRFLENLRDIVVLILDSQPNGVSPTLQLRSVYRAILKKAESMPDFAQSALRRQEWYWDSIHNHEGHDSSAKPLIEILQRIEDLISAGVKANELVEPPGGVVAIRRTLVGHAQLQLSALFLNNDAASLAKRQLDAQVEWLRVLKIYCTPTVSEEISNEIARIVGDVATESR